MSLKTVYLPEIGELKLYKRKGTKNIRLSVSGDGSIKVSLPNWAPYAAGISFAKSRADWITKHRPTNPKITLQNNDRIGKSYRINYVYQPTINKTSTRILPRIIKISSYLAMQSPAVQQKAVTASERALKKEAESLLPQRLSLLAAENNFRYKKVQVKKMTSRWGSCSNDKTITLNYFLMQLPWPLIDYVLLHELVHTVHLNHSPKFWHDFDKILPQAKQKRSQLKAYKPMLIPLSHSVA